VWAGPATTARHTVEVKHKGYGIEPKAGTDDGVTGKNCCVACREPTRWVTIGGWCGHHGVCTKCMVRDRFFQQKKRCYICGIQCPKVLVAETVALREMLASPSAKCTRGRRKNTRESLPRVQHSGKSLRECLPRERALPRVSKFVHSGKPSPSAVLALGKS
jgi:hypothetical protein